MNISCGGALNYTMAYKSAYEQSLRRDELKEKKKL